MAFCDNDVAGIKSNSVKDLLLDLLPSLRYVHVQKRPAVVEEGRTAGLSDHQSDSC